jgi:hypothetical protein
MEKDRLNQGKPGKTHGKIRGFFPMKYMKCWVEHGLTEENLGLR